MKLWIDADAGPHEVKQIVFRAAKRLSIETILVANRPLATPAGVPTAKSVTVAAGANVADQYIVEHAWAGDVVVTADIPLAAQLVQAGIWVIDPRGDLLTADNIAGRLSMRDFADELRGAGIVTSGSAPYGDRDKRAFAATFDATVTKAMRQETKRQKSTQVGRKLDNH